MDPEGVADLVGSRPDTHVIDVVVIDLDEWAWAGDLLQSLDAEERAWANRLRSDELRRRYVVAHAALRLVLAAWTLEDAGSIVIERLPCWRCGQPHGRPAIAGGVGPHFSLSHCPDRALIAVSWMAPLGVDVEDIRPLSNASQMAAYVASADEVALVRESPDPALAFLGLWVRKEAVVKATGEGISRAGAYSFAHGSPPGWSVSMIDVDEWHVAAVAHHGAPTSISTRRFGPGDLAGGSLVPGVGTG